MTDPPQSKHGAPQDSCVRSSKSDYYYLTLIVDAL